MVILRFLLLIYIIAINALISGSLRKSVDPHQNAPLSCMGAPPCFSTISKREINFVDKLKIYVLLNSVSVKSG